MNNRIINDGIPKEFYEILSKNFYDADDQEKMNAFCSVTDLLNPPKIYWLKKRHSGEIYSKASEKIWSVFGSVTHLMMELALKDNPNYEIEKRIYKEFDIDGRKIVISGKFDIYEKDTRTLKDLKTTSIYKILSLIDGEEEKFPLQTNIYKYLMKDKYPVRNIEILFLTKDHDKRRAMNDNRYPKNPVGSVQIRILEESIVKSFIENKLAEMLKYENTPDDDIPPCPFHERYQNPPKIALYSETGLTQKNTIKKTSNATKLFDTVDEVIEYISSHQMYKFGLQFRPLGQPKRCIDYCEYNQHCNFYRQHLMSSILDKEVVDFVLDFKTQPSIDELTSKIKKGFDSLDDSDKKIIKL